MEGKPNFNPGANQFANTMMHMMRGISGEAAKTQVDFGIINADYSLTCKSFSQPIPKNDYSVCRSLLYNPGVPLTETYVDGGHDHEGTVPYETHYHQVKLPKKMYWLRPGQKVLVAIIGNEFVIIDIVYNGSWLGESEPPWA